MYHLGWIHFARIRDYGDISIKLRFLLFAEMYFYDHLTAECPFVLYFVGCISIGDINNSITCSADTLQGSSLYMV